MTISTTAAKSRYAGDGSTNSFPTGFKFLTNEHVRVILQRADGSESLWAEGSEYDLTGAGLPGGGTVEATTSPVDHTPAAGETLVVKLAVPPRQETSLPLGGAFPSTAVEAMADLAALRDQQIEEALSRAPKLKETTALADVAFPEPEAGRPIGWNAAGDGLANLPGLGRWQGDWAPAAQYIALDVVRDPLTKNIYVCEAAHTSGTFATDLAAEKWSEAIKVEDVEAARAAAEAAQAVAQAAQTAAETAEASAEMAQVAAEASASAATTSATNASDSATAAAGSAGIASAAAGAAQAAESNAESAAAAAEAAHVAAETARDAAQAAQATAETAVTNAETAETGAVAAKDAAEALYGSLAAVEAAKTAAETAEVNAETAETNAETAATNAASSASAAATLATNAANSATAAASSASSALSSAMTASNAATAAQTAETNAETAEAAAATAATNAGNSATAAAASAAQVENTKLIWRGDWGATTAYAVNDAVANDGVSYICIEGHTNEEPPNAAYWDVLVAKGDQGVQGVQGVQGEQGDPGIGIVPQGPYSAGTNYDLNDGVIYQGSFWRSLQNANQGNTPESSPAFWEETVEKGDKGDTGDPGNDGVFTQIASQGEAEAGTSNTSGMTPLRTAQAIAALGGGGSGGGGIELLTSIDCAGLSTVNFLEIDEYGDFSRFLLVVDEAIQPSSAVAMFFAEIGEFGGSNWETGSYRAFGQSILDSPAAQEIWHETNRIRFCPAEGMGEYLAGQFWYTPGRVSLGEPRWTWNMAGSTHASAGGGGWIFGTYLKNDVRFRVSTGSIVRGRIALFGVHGA